MRIGIDAIAAVGRSGNSTYSRELLRELLSQDTKDTLYLFSFLHELRKKHQFKNVGVAQRKYVYPYVSPPYYPFSTIELVNEKLVRIASALCKIELFHFTNPQNFVSGSYKSIVTIHDLAPLYGVAWVKENYQKQFPELMKKVTEHADHIIAVSEYTKKDIVEKLGISTDRITVVYEGASSFFHPDHDLEYLANTFGIRDYVLYTGQLQPRKNLLQLVRAWGRYKKSAKMRTNFKLVLAGGARDSAYEESVKECIREEGVTDSVVLTGSVDDVTLRKLYSSARCFVYPSLFEGFGLPIVEALQCGTPVIASNTTSLPEVVGDAGILVNPDDSTDIARALTTMIEDDDIHAVFQKRARVQAATFSWKNAAQQTYDVYTRCKT